MWDIPDNEDADVTVEVTAGSWYWGFEYANGYETENLQVLFEYELPRSSCE